MRLFLPFAVFFIVIFTGCHKPTNCIEPKLTGCNEPDPCNSNAASKRKITDQPATIKAVAGQFYIIEQNSIDTRLLPCNLCTEFQVDNLKVTVTGNVKDAVNNGSGPCCTDNFEITRISK